MKLLEAEPAVVPPPAPAPAQEPPAEAPAPARTCAACEAPMEDGQDWCLRCGTAADGRLGARMADWRGTRAALAVAGLTLALLAGAVVAAYAAMSGDAAREASGPVAAAEAGAPVAAPTPGVPAAEAAPVEPVPTTDLPPVTSGDPGGADVQPVEPIEPVTPVDPTPTSTPTPTDEEPTGEGTDAPASTNEPPAAQPIELAEGAGDLYDPLGRATGEPGDPARALDGDEATSWAVASSNALEPGVGYVVDVGEVRGIRELRLRTSTPGFKVEVFATDEATAPPEITDTRWAHIRDRSDVKAEQRIVLGGGTTEYRQVLLWFTRPPADGGRIRLSELRLLG